MTESVQTPDLDFTAFLAARRELRATPVVVQVNQRPISFRPTLTAVGLLSLATGADADDMNAKIISDFYHDSLSADDYAFVVGLGSDPESGFDQRAFYTLFRQVTEVTAGRPTPPSAT